MPFATSRGSVISSHGFESDPEVQAAIHRLYVATNDLDLGRTDQLLLPKMDSLSGVSKPNLPNIPQEASSSFEIDKPESLPPVSLEPPMSLEEIVMSTHWQRVRGVTQSMPVLPTVSSISRNRAESCATLGSSSAINPRTSSTSRGFVTLRREDTLHDPLGAKARKRREALRDESSLAAGARDVLATRKTTREHQFKFKPRFTDGRRRAALMRCLESIEREQLDPTLSEVARRLMREGWQMKEVNEHLLLLSEDPHKFNVTSGRELAELRPQGQASHLPAIVEACGGEATHVNSAEQLRGRLQDFKQTTQRERVGSRTLEADAIW
jgi:hypothetical protein